MRKIRWFHIISIVFLALLLVPLSPIYPAEVCYSENDQTLVALTFDDGYSCWVSNVMPILELYDLTATAFVTDPDAGGDPTFTWADIQELHNAGWEIGWHTARHIDLTLTDESEIIKDFDGCEVLFRDHGLPTPVSFAYPNGAHDSTSMRIVSKYFLAARTWHIGVNSPCHVQSHPVHVKTLPLTRGLSCIKEEVNRQSAQGMFIVCSVHTVGQTAWWQDKPDMTVQEFKDLAKFLADEKQEGNIDVVTFQEGVQHMQQREVASSWGVKVDSPFDPCFDAYGLPVPRRYLTLYENIIQDFIGHRYPQIARWFDRVVYGPVGLSILVAVLSFVIVSIVVAGISFRRKKLQ